MVKLSKLRKIAKKAEKKAEKKAKKTKAKVPKSDILTPAPPMDARGRTGLISAGRRPPVGRRNRPQAGRSAWSLTNRGR